MNEERKRRLLWVDDEPTVLMMVAMLLQGHNYEVETANSAQEAFDLIDSGAEFDLVGTDIRMAKCDGLEMSREIKKVYPNLPIIVVSAHASDEAKEIASDIGIYAYINKPFKVDDLLRAIEGAINSAQA